MIGQKAMKRNLKQRKKSERSGLATTELAVCLPIFLVLVFGTIESCQRIFLRQSAVIVAYEGARLAARGSSTNAEVVARCESLLTSRRVRNAVIEVTPSNFNSASPGTEVSVRISVPWSDNTPTKVVLKDQGSLVVNSVMLRE